MESPTLCLPRHIQGPAILSFMLLQVAEDVLELIGQVLGDVKPLDLTLQLLLPQLRQPDTGPKQCRSGQPPHHNSHQTLASMRVSPTLGAVLLARFAPSSSRTAFEAWAARVQELDSKIEVQDNAQQQVVSCV